MTPPEFIPGIVIVAALAEANQRILELESGPDGATQHPASLDTGQEQQP